MKNKISVLGRACTFRDLLSNRGVGAELDKKPDLPARCGYQATFARRPGDVIMDDSCGFGYLDWTFAEYGRREAARPVRVGILRHVVHSGASADMHELVSSRRHWPRFS